MNLSIDEVEALVYEILIKAGFDHSNAQAVMSTIVAGEVDGCSSHGLWRTLGCISTLKNNKVIPNAEPQVKDISSSLLVVDAKGGFSPLAFNTGLPYLIKKTKAQGIAAMSINHCVHFSALWVEIEKITKAGLVAFAFTPSHAWVAPFGGNEPTLGTNPIAFGWPRGKNPPFIFDFATSEIARGDIQLYQREGRNIPIGWGIDRTGKVCSDPNEVLNHGAMLAFGEHKGSALSIMVELIAGPLIGDLTSVESLIHDQNTKSSPYHGELLIAINPSHFLGESLEDNFNRGEKLFESIVKQGARLPSQRRYQNRKHSLENGLNIPEDLYQELVALKD